jgi:hypothetical protein
MCIYIVHLHIYMCIYKFIFYHVYAHMYIYKPTTCFKAHGGSRALALTPRAATLAPVSSHQHNEQMRSLARYWAQATQLALDLVVFLWLFFVFQVCCCCFRVV